MTGSAAVPLQAPVGGDAVHPRLADGVVSWTRRPLAGLVSVGPAGERPRASLRSRYVYQLTVDWTESVCSGSALVGSRRAATSSIRRSVADGSPAWNA